MFNITLSITERSRSDVICQITIATDVADLGVTPFHRRAVMRITASYYEDVCGAYMCTTVYILYIIYCIYLYVFCIIMCTCVLFSLFTEAVKVYIMLRNSYLNFKETVIE